MCVDASRGRPRKLLKRVMKKACVTFLLYKAMIFIIIEPKIKHTNPKVIESILLSIKV